MITISFLVFSFIISIFAYGIFLPFLGYYDDEWVGVYNLSAIGHTAMVDYTSMDRPFWGWIWSYIGLLLGHKPFTWHVFAFLMRWLSSISLWFMLRAIWPKYTKEVTAIALLFLLYPGILQESRAFFFFFFWLQLSLVFFSFAIMIRSVRESRHYLVFNFIALISLLPTWFINEYFVGLEILRPIVLWFILSNYCNDLRNRTILVLKHWLPYAICLLLYVLWHIFFFETSRKEVSPLEFISAIRADPANEVLSRLNLILPDIVETTFLAWSQVLSSDLLKLSSSSSWLAWLLGTLSGLLSYFYFFKGTTYTSFPRTHKTIGGSNFASALITGGIIAIVAGMAPLWFSGVDFQLTDMYTRYALPAMPGACLLFFGLIVSVTGNWNRLVSLVCVLVALATGMHVKVANDYRHVWVNQKQLVWQLIWRIPHLKPGTLIVIDHERWQTKRWPSPFGDMHYAAPINLAYRPDDSPTKLNYWAILIENNDERIRTISNSRIPFHKRVRNLEFTQISGQQITVSYSAGKCLEVVDKKFVKDIKSRQLLTDIAEATDRNLIVNRTNPLAKPPVSIFGREPSHEWCYYHQKARLAHQFRDWQALKELHNEAKRKGVKPNHPDNWNIFKET